MEHFLTAWALLMARCCCRTLQTVAHFFKYKKTFSLVLMAVVVDAQYNFVVLDRVLAHMDVKVMVMFLPIPYLGRNLKTCSCHYPQKNH